MPQAPPRCTNCWRNRWTRCGPPRSIYRRRTPTSGCDLANSERACGSSEAPGSPTRQPRWGGPPEGSGAQRRRRVSVSGSHEPLRGAKAPSNSGGGGAPPHVGKVGAPRTLNMDAKDFLFIGLGAMLIVYFTAIVRGGLVRPTVVQTAIGFVTAFFDTLGIGSFATTTSVYKLRRMVPVKLIPGTLNVGHTLPTIAQAFIYTRIVPVESATLVPMIAAACAGSWLGAGIVVRWPRRKIQIGMGL